MSTKRILIIVGSPRKAGTSYSFSRTIKMLAEQLGHSADICFAIDYLDGKHGIPELRSTLGQSDIVAVVSSVYVDSLPYPLVWFLERLASDLAAELKGKSLFGIAQCAFPDISLCEPAIESCRCFAEVTQMRWLGGLAYPGGVLISGAHVEDLGGRGLKITQALKLALQDVLNGAAIGTDAQQVFAPHVLRVLYRPLAVALNYRNRKAAERQGTDITRKVYLQ